MDYRRYGFGDLVIHKDIELEKYATIKTKSGETYDVECFFVEEEEEEEG